MGRPIRFTDLMRRLAEKSRLSEKTVRKVYNNLFELVTEELRFADEVKLKRFGTFYTIDRGGHDKKVPRPDGTLELKFIEPYKNIRFKPAAEMMNYTNGRIVDKESKKRERKGQLTKNEKKLLKYKPHNEDYAFELELEQFMERKRNGEK